MRSNAVRAVVASTIFLVGTWPLAAQTVRCEFSETSVELVGSCRRDSVQTPADVSRRQLLAPVWPDAPVRASISAGPESPGPWQGEFSFNEWDLPFQLAQEMLEPGTSRLVVRTELAWVIAYEWETAGETAAVLTFDLADYPLASETDVAILQRAVQAFERLDTWDRNDDRDCDNDAPGEASLFCLIAAAIEEHMGTYHHRQPALEVIRGIIRERWPERLTGHPLMDFNNHPDTTRGHLRMALMHALGQCRTEALSIR